MQAGRRGGSSGAARRTGRERRRSPRLLPRHYGGRDLDVVGLTADGRLISFDSDRPGRAKTEGAIRGLTMDTRLVGIDYRPASGNDGDSGDLYGLGDRGGVYVIDDDSGKATLRSRSNVALEGTSFGVDFNPTVDRLRVVSDTGQNLRVNVDDGSTLTDGRLAYPASLRRRHPGHRRDRRGVHQQRRRSKHSDHAVRHRLDARPDGRSSRRPTRVCWPRPGSSRSTPAPPSARTSTAPCATAPPFACRALPRSPWADRAASTRSSCSVAARHRRGASAPATR